MASISTVRVGKCKSHGIKCKKMVALPEVAMG